MLESPTLANNAFALPNVLEMLVSDVTASPTRPFALPSCWLTEVNAPTSERTFCATAKAAPSSVASDTR